MAEIVPFDRKRAISEMIEGLAKIQQANRKNLMRAEKMIEEAQESIEAYRVLDSYVKGELANLVAVKRKIEEEEKQG